VLRFLRFALLLFTVLVAPRVSAANEAGIVVLMEHTAGPAAWTAAERRLVAELRALQMRVDVAGAVTDLDEELPDRVLAAGAFVGIQVLRDGDRGIIRFWFAPQRGQRSGYQHIEINLRNAEVVSAAVLPVVEAIFDRTLTSMHVADPPDVRVAAASDPCEGVSSGLCEAPMALRLGGGAFLVHADSGATTGFGLGLRFRLWAATRLEIDGAYLSRSTSVEGEQPHAQRLLRLHLMFEAWGKDGRGAALGPGIGLVHSSSLAGTSLLPSAGVRAAVFAPLSKQVNLAFTLSGARLVDAGGYSGNPWLVDAMLNLDWYFWK